MEAGALRLPQLDTETRISLASAPSSFPSLPQPCTAETAECTCPEPCERDHDRD